MLALSLIVWGAAAGCGAAPARPAQFSGDVMDVLRDMERRRGIGVSRADGEVLRRLVEENKVQHAVEIGTYRGYSGVWTALGLQATGGKLTTFELDPAMAEEARGNFVRAGVDGRISQVIGDAHKEVLKLPNDVDFVFIDADKEGYLDYLQKLLPKMKPGGLILAHNVRYPEPDPAFMRAIRTDPRLETTFANMDGAGISVSRVKAK